MSQRACLFVLPATSVVALFFFLPVVVGFSLSLTDFDIYAIASLDNLRWIGLRNYTRLVDDPLFWTALRNTLYFVLVGGPLSIAVSFAAALLLNAGMVRFRSLFRTIFFIPVVTTLVAVAVVWRHLYHPRYGLLNQLLGALGIAPIDWLGDPFWAMPAIILLAVWKNFGFNMVIFLAGLQSIPERLYEAARLDGASSWQQLYHITLPSLRPTLTFVIAMTSVGYFQLFAEPYVMTSGGPAQATLSIVLLMYQQGFRWWNMGYAAAIAFVLFAILLLAMSFRLLFRGTPGSVRHAGARL